MINGIKQVAPNRSNLHTGPTRPLDVCLVVWYTKPINKAYRVKFGALLSVLKLIKP
jgi:hypothetical protein